MSHRSCTAQRLAVTVAALAAAGVVSRSARAFTFGSFEGSQPDNFGGWTGSAVVPFGSDTTGTVYSYSTIGATDGTTALDVNHSGFDQNVAYDFKANNLVSQFTANDILAFDVTYPTFSTGTAGTLTLQTSTGSALVDVQAGTQKLNLPITLLSNTTFNTAGGTTLLVSNPLTINPGVRLSQTGTGTVTYQSTITVLAGGSVAFGNSSHAAALSLDATSMATVTAHGSNPVNVLQLDSLSFLNYNTTGSLNLKDSELIVNATADTIRGYLADGQLKTDTPGGAVGYKAITGGQTQAQFTLLGDSDLDGRVNVADVANLAGNFGKTSGQLWISGDFDYNGNANVADLADLAGNFGKDLSRAGLSSGGAAAPTAMTLVAVLPEPGALCLLTAVGAGVVLSHRHRRRYRAEIESSSSLIRGKGLCAEYACLPGGSRLSRCCQRLRCRRCKAQRRSSPSPAPMARRGRRVLRAIRGAAVESATPPRAITQPPRLTIPIPRMEQTPRRPPPGLAAAVAPAVTEMSAAPTVEPAVLATRVDRLALTPSAP
jgi:hypothetical protein